MDYKILESPLDSKEIKPVNPKGNQSWTFIGKTDAEAPILWPPDVKNWLSGKDSDAGKDWRREEKETSEDKIIGWHHRLDGHEFEQFLGIGDGQGSLACCSPWGCRESDVTEQLNWTELNGHLWNLAYRAEPQGLPCWLCGKESACNEAGLGSIPGSGRTPGEGHGNPLQHSCLENPMDRGAWWFSVQRVTKSRTRLSDWVHT